MFDWLKRKRSLVDAVFETRDIVVHGVPFTIKKINTFHYLDGSKVMLQAYQTYQVGKTPAALDVSGRKLQDHYRDVLMAGVVSPKLVRKPEEPGFFVDHLFENSALAMAVYQEIILFTYGKKKSRALRLPKND